jgi:hypothetical protein
MTERDQQRRRKRVSVAPLTPLRAYRLERGIRIVDVAERAGISAFRVSIIERHPGLAERHELDAHRAAIDAIHAERNASGGAA